MVVNNGTKINEKDIIYITEMLMRQLLELDKVEAAGEGKMQRKMEVCFQCHLCCTLQFQLILVCVAN